ncbi:hypothetical protein JCM30760_27040 [Thiomicrorhabdus hydrogeniphila]
MIKFNKVQLLPKEDSGIHNLLIRVHGSHINSTFKRREPVVIVNPENNAKCIRYVMGAGSMAGITKSTLAVDYDALDTLGFKMRKEQECLLIVRKPKPFEVYSFLMRHPDLSVQLSIKLGVLGSLLGLLSAVQMVVSVFS